MALPVNVDQLISGKAVEWERLEFKKSWNPESVVHTVCAFANDINNWGGGYVVLGVESRDGKPILPPTGLQDNQIDPIQKKLLEVCNLITPTYFPVAEPVQVKGKQVLILWIPGGDNRPYKAPEKLGTKSHSVYWVRRFSNTKKADRTEERQLLEVAAKVPFDDRINHQASLDDLKLPLIQSFLQEVKSSLFEQSGNMEFQDLCKQMDIVRGPNEYLRPVNVGLMFFNERPDGFFKGAKIEVVEYKDDVGDDFAEKSFTGPIHHQLRQSLQYLKTSVLQEQVKKIPGVAEAHRFYNYPYEALEEALANAVYHRGYEDLNSIEISVRHDRIEILSYPGPEPPVDNKQLKRSRVLARFYRNRRVGDFLKELDLTEGRGTGIPKIRKAMRDNGSPPARFETDRLKTYFLTTLPAHQAAVRPITMAEPETILTRILRFCRSPRSRKEILQHIGLTNHPKNYKAHIVPLLEKGYLKLTIPDKPKSSKQKYVIASNGQRLLVK
jgi:ATP-dependent DNA helicase RecG